jgi:hypothetical protein
VGAPGGFGTDAFPAAYHGFSWWQIDVFGYLIRLLKLLRLACNVRMPTVSARARQHARPDAFAAPRPAG